MPLAIPDIGDISTTEVFSYELLANGELGSRGTTEIKTNAVPEPAPLLLFGMRLFAAHHQNQECFPFT
jgi:hypothetical protein